MQDDGEAGTARSGGTFDPRRFKGNIQLENHFNECALSMIPCKKKPIKSNSYLMKKKIGQGVNKVVESDDDLNELTFGDG